MPEEVKIISEHDEFVEQEPDHYVKVTTVKKKKTVTVPVDVKPEDFMPPAIAKEYDITPEEKQSLVEILHEEGLIKKFEVEKVINFEEQKEHELTDEETIEYLLNRLYTPPSSKG